MLLSFGMLSTQIQILWFKCLIHKKLSQAELVFLMDKAVMCQIGGGGKAQALCGCLPTLAPHTSPPAIITVLIYFCHIQNIKVKFIVQSLILKVWIMHTHSLQSSLDTLRKERLTMLKQGLRISVGGVCHISEGD